MILPGKNCVTGFHISQASRAVEGAPEYIEDIEKHTISERRKKLRVEGLILDGEGRTFVGFETHGIQGDRELVPLVRPQPPDHLTYQADL